VSGGRDDARVREACVEEWRRSSEVEAREKTRARSVTRYRSDNEGKKVVVRRWCETGGDDE